MTSHQAAVSAAVAVAESHGILVHEPVVLHDSFSLRIHLRPAPLVARVPTVTALGRPSPGDALAREAAVVSFLHAAGAPVVPPSDLLPPGPYVQDGVAVSFWAHVEHDPDHVITPDAAGRALAELHAVLRGFPGELPRLGPVLEEPARLLAALAGVCEPDVLGRLRDAHAELAARLSEVGEVQAVHGDAHPGNLLATPGGLLWNDFEETTAGPVGWDLVCLRRTTRLDGHAALRAYGVDPDDPALRVYGAARALQGTLWVLARAARSPQRWGPSARAALDSWLRDPQGR
ncbi:Thiamine kinase [Nonomuraea maritima]|uniref:Thiamine kinase n=1 Tax=Nonomuraea maritima TaxID=683260 RepID=A0A1G8ZAK1_9ACTN|nr:aminoglycoside phosphotransferase family protein [Nonomuraea maritima]SDK11190.1 Thiamine kinase [Nonomuraea maritima]